MQRSNRSRGKTFRDFASFFKWEMALRFSQPRIHTGRKKNAIGDTVARLQLPVGGPDNMTVSWHGQPNRALGVAAGG
jgi:hypothetical protein